MPKQKVTSRNSGIVSSVPPYDISGGASSSKSNGRSSSLAEVPSTSQPSGISSDSNRVLSEADLERKAAELVQYFLIADQKKIPIRKLDINNHVLKDNKKHFSAVVKKAQNMLLDVFGCDLLELDGKMKGRYILVRKKYEGVTGELDMVCSEEALKLGLLFNILAIIYMNGGIISDTELWNTLRKLGVDPDCRHDIFGDVHKLVLDEFVKQAYLEYVKQINSDPPFYQFHWGERAKHELLKKDVLVHVSKIYGKEPTEWKSLWQDCDTREQGLSQMET